MKELSDDRETAMPDQKEATNTANTTNQVEAEEEDDSELDRLLRHAMLLLRGKTSNNQFNNSMMGEAVEPTDEEEDELLQRAVTLLRQRTKQPESDAEQTSELQEEVEELDRLLQRAMALFAERRKRSLPTGEKDNTDTELDVVWLKTIKVATGSASPGSPGLTDDEDDEDDELDNLLRRAMSLLRRRLREPSIVQESNADTQTPLMPAYAGGEPTGLEVNVAAAALNRVQLEENQKRPRHEVISDERKSKRARCLIEFQEGDDVELAEAQTNELSNLGTIEQPIEATEIPTKTGTPDDGRPQVEQRHHEPQCVTVNSADPVPGHVQTIQQTVEESADENELQTLRVTNTKLMEENADLKQQLQQQKLDNNSDARIDA